MDAFTLLSLVIFNADSWAYEIPNNLSTKLELDYDIEITKQVLGERFREYAIKFLKTALKKSILERVEKALSE